MNAEKTTISSWILIPILGAIAGLTPFAIDMYLPSLPSIATELRIPVESAQLTLSAFMIGFAVGQLLYGPLADSFGRKKIVLIGLTLFVIASIGCSLTHSLPALIGWRTLQAIGGASGSVVINAILRDMFDRNEFSRMMSFVILTMTIAPLIAPFIGGYLLLIASWRSIFWTLVLLGLLVLAGFYWFIPETLPIDERQPLKLSQVGRNFLEVLRHGPTMGYILTSSFTTAGLFAFLSSASFVYIEFFHVKPENFGFVYGLNVVTMMVLTYLNSKLVRGMGSERLLRLGLWSATISSLILAWNAWRGGGLWSIAIPLMFFIGPLSIIGANSMAGILTHFKQKAGTASALAGTLRFGLGGVAGIIINIQINHSPLPMASIMAICGLLALFSYYTLVYPKLHQTQR